MFRIVQNFKPFIGNGDISIWMNNSRLGQQTQTNKQTKISYWIWIINNFAIPVLKRWFSNTTTIWILVHFQKIAFYEHKDYLKKKFILIVFQLRKVKNFRSTRKHVWYRTLNSLLMLKQWYCYDFVYIVLYALMKKNPTFVPKTIIYFWLYIKYKTSCRIFR